VRSLRLLSVVLALTCGVASAQLEEIFSRYVTVAKPKGAFADRLIRLRPPAGTAWKEVEDAKSGLRLKIPADAQVDAKAAGSRVLAVQLAGGAPRPRPGLRVDLFTPEKGDETQVDAEYATEYAERYSESSFNGKFNLTDSGMLVLDKKYNLAMVGGAYPVAAVQATRLQCQYLSRDRQIMVTFDCAQQDWDTYQDTVGQILLSLDFSHLKAP
jgi:hypothetical protein